MKRGFTLLELIVVILLLSLLSFLVVSSVKKASLKKEVIDIPHIKNLVKGEGGAYELLCVRNCKRCVLVDDNYKTREVRVDFGTDLKAYIVDETNQASQLEFGRAFDEKICLRFIFFKNGSTSKMIIKSKDRFYLIPSYFGKVKRFESLGDAKDYWVQDNSLVRGMGDFLFNWKLGKLGRLGKELRKRVSTT